MATKEFKTLEEQIQILDGRGLKISDNRENREFLLFNNYYRISGYSLTLRNHDVFMPTATFENIIDIYRFDWNLRHILGKYLELIEVKFKSIYAYEFAKVYGGLGYLNATVFTDQQKYSEILNKAYEQRDSRKDHEPYIKHFLDQNEEIPIWAFVDLFTIGEISKLYGISPQNVQLAVAASFDLTMSKGVSILAQYMHGMTIVRNLCAHGSRLFNRLFRTKPSLNKDEIGLLRVDGSGIKDNARLFGYILNMRRLMGQKLFHAMITEIEGNCREYPFVALRYYGFPDDWKSKVMNLETTT